MIKLLMTSVLALVGLFVPIRLGPEWVANRLGASLETVLPPLAGRSTNPASRQLAPGFPFAITGSASFVANIRNGLDLMRRESPADYTAVATYVTEIREGPQNWAWGGSSVIQISSSSAAFSRAYAGSIILHEATHVKNWSTNNFPVFGCAGEAKSLAAQADYLARVGDAAMATWVRGLVGSWC
jgi:hypothetical protein